MGEEVVGWRGERSGWLAGRPAGGVRLLFGVAILLCGEDLDALRLGLYAVYYWRY
jgi:hypothetical protein